MNKRTLFEDFVQLSVRLNGLVVPGRLIERTLAAYSFNLVVYNNHETYKVSLVGSATAVHFNGRYILLCSNHQLRDVDPQQVAMLRDGGRFLVTSGGTAPIRLVQTPMRMTSLPSISQSPLKRTPI
ncbi:MULTISPECIES: hypothetical protein [unclassified Mesorhizobium]|uniref:hypothetical protein n=1 Tax=unclassified Mesorhizobium TaxID=325217 RepID=UPI00333D6C34